MVSDYAYAMEFGGLWYGARPSMALRDVRRLDMLTDAQLFDLHAEIQQQAKAVSAERRRRRKKDETCSKGETT